MAIDSAEKRRSVAGIGVPALVLGVTPNSDQDLEWRQQAGWGYSGIAPGNPATLLVDAMLVDQDIGYYLMDQDTPYILVETDTSRYVIKKVN